MQTKTFALAIAWLCLAAGLATAADASKISFNIPALSLADGLAEWSKQTGLQVLRRDTNGATELTTHSVTGQYSPAEALEKLLASTGLTYEFVNDHTVRVAPMRTNAETTSYSLGRKETRIVLAQNTGPEGASTKQSAEDTESSPNTNKESLAEIIVTGSLLNRSAADVAKPVVTLQTEDLIKAGATNPEQILQQIGQNQAFSVSNTSVGLGTAAGSYANLRSLGSPRTLVLLDGKRLVNNPYQTAGVDLNTVPTALVKEVQVLATGGSSTYGTDAIAGVINFITPKELQGFDASATGTMPEAKGGGQTFLANLNGGFGSLADNGWNVYGGASYRKQIELRNLDRHFSSTGYVPQLGMGFLQSRSNPANYNQPATGLFDFVNPDPSCGPPPVVPADALFGPGACGYDILSQVDIMLPQEQRSALVKGTLKLGDNHTASLEYVRGDSQLLSIVSQLGPNGLTMPSTSPFYPGNGITPADPRPGFDPTQDIHFGWRLTDLGRRTAEVLGYTDRGTAQLEGRLGSWDYQASASISTSVVKISLKRGYSNVDLLQAGLTSGVLNPFGPQDDAGMTYLKDTVEVNGLAQRAVGDLKVYGVQFNRELFQLPGGRVAIAVAADYKQENARLGNNFAVTSQIPQTFANNDNVRGDRSSKSVSFEANLPLLEKLEASLSVRYDDYSDFGNTVNPEVGLTYKATHWLTMRGSYSTAFRAPTLYDIFQPGTIGFTSTNPNDPILCPDGNVNTAAGGIELRDCNNSSLNAIHGGNPKLDPEKSNAYTVGFVLKPLEHTIFTVDYFNYHLKDTIDQLGDNAIFANPTKYADRIVRCLDVPTAERSNYETCNFGTLAGNPIAYVIDRLSNLGDTKTSGLDVTVDWSGPETPMGIFGVRYTGTYVSQYEFQREPGGEFLSRAGRYVDSFPVLRYVHSLTGSWNRGPTTVEVTHRYKGGYTDCNEPCLIDDSSPQFFRNVKAFQTFDLSAIYRWNDHLSLFGTIENVTNQAPPFSNGAGAQSNGTNFDDRFTNGLQRTYLLTATYKF